MDRGSRQRAAHRSTPRPPLAWAAKSLVTKYGNKETYKSARGFFIGLIAGELFIVVVSMLLAYAAGLATGIDLNRQ